MTTRPVYVELLGEDVDVWRPVEAIEDGEAFVLSPTSPEGERWRFRPGSRVRREQSDEQAHPRQPSAVVARSGGACHVKDAELADEP